MAATASGGPSNSSTCSNLVPSDCRIHPPNLLLQIQQPQQQQQQQQRRRRLALPWSRQRHRDSTFTTFAASGTIRHSSSDASLQQQEQMQLRQLQQHRLHKQQHPPPQRMLRWLFTGQTGAVRPCGPSCSSQQQPQLYDAGDVEQCNHSA